MLRYILIAVFASAVLYGLGSFVIGPNLGRRTRLYTYSWGVVSRDPTLPPPFGGWSFVGLVAGPRYGKNDFPSIKVKLSGELFAIDQLTEDYVIAHSWTSEYAGAEPSELRAGARIFSKGNVAAVFRFGELFGFSFSVRSNDSDTVDLISSDGKTFRFPMTSSEVIELFGEPNAVSTKWYYL
jgi:hypothetical protein